MLFKDELVAQSAYLKRLQLLLEKRLRQMPEGRLVPKISRGKRYYYVDRNGTLESLWRKPEQVEQYKEKDAIKRGRNQLMG